MQPKKKRIKEKGFRIDLKPKIKLFSKETSKQLKQFQKNSHKSIWT